MQKKTAYKAIALLAVLLVVSIAGCHEDEKRVKLIDKQEKETVIHLFSSDGLFSSSNQAKYWSENFSAQTGVHAVIDYEEGWYYAENGRDGRALLRKRITSSRPDDMYIINAEDMVEYARKGYLLDMSEFDFVSRLSEMALRLSTVDGKVYCLPLSYTGFGLYWNMDLLKKYDLKVPENYGELLTVWDTLVENGITPYAGNKGYALTVPVMCLSFSEIYKSENQEQLLKELADGTTPVSTYARKGFMFLKLMCDKGYLNPKETLATVPNGKDEAAKFMNSEAACVSSLMNARDYGDPVKTGFAVKLTGWPLLENGQVSVVGTSQKLCINPKSKHLAIVKKFVEMAGTEEALLKCTEDGKVSAGKKNNPCKYREVEREFCELIQSNGQIPNADMRLKLNLWENIRDVSRLILAGEATVDQACQMLDEAQQRTIAKNNS